MVSFECHTIIKDSDASSNSRRPHAVSHPQVLGQWYAYSRGFHWPRYVNYTAMLIQLLDQAVLCGFEQSLPCWLTRKVHVSTTLRQPFARR